MDNKRNRRANRVVWVAVLMFAASIFCQGFNSELGFRIAGGIAILFSLIGLFWGLDWDDDRIDSFFQKLLRRKPKKNS